MTAEIKECSLLERTDIEYTNKTPEKTEALSLADSEKKDVCPFYKGKENNKICCEPLIPDTGLSIEFHSEDQMKDYMERFCKGSHNKCLFAQEHGRKKDK